MTTFVLFWVGGILGAASHYIVVEWRKQTVLLAKLRGAAQSTLGEVPVTESPLLRRIKRQQPRRGVTIPQV